MKKTKCAARILRILSAAFISFLFLSILSPVSMSVSSGGPLSAPAQPIAEKSNAPEISSIEGFDIAYVPKAPAGVSTISWERARDLLLLAAGKYNENLRPSDILSGNPGEGEADYTRPLTRLEAIVMISKAFGRLPEPAGDLSRIGAAVPHYNDVPRRAAEDVENLATALVLLPSPDNHLYGDEILEETEFRLMLNRVYALFSSAPVDDFYHAVNKSWLEKNTLRAGEYTHSAFDEPAYEIDSQINGILDTILTGVWSKGSKEQKIADLYKCIINTDGRNSVGCDPIKPHIDRIARSNALDELEEAIYTISEELGIDLFFSFTIEPDIFDGSQYAVYFNCPVPNLPKVFSSNRHSPQMSALYQYAVALFELAGDGNPADSAEAVIKIESNLADAMRNPAQLVNYADDYKEYRMDRLEALFPAKDFIKLSGISAHRQEDSFIIRDAGLLYAFAAEYSEENLAGLKAYAEFKLLDACSDILSESFSNARFAFFNAVMGQSEKPNPARYAKTKLQTLMAAYLGEIYAEKYFSQAAKRDVEAMARILIEVYKTRIDNLDWMGDGTKEAAKNKLDALRVKVGIPQKWECAMEAVNVLGPADGGTFFDNMTSYYRQTRLFNAKKQGKPVNADSWDVGLFTVNAYYKPSANEIIIPMGMLQAPFYEHGRKKEANLGGIGCIIAHELTHAIDYHGAQFDENGCINMWWTDEDSARFADMCNNIAAHYSGYEAAAGIANDGELTLIENIADLGMLACALDAVETLANPDYRLFFTSAAKIWASTSTRETLAYNAQADSHSSANARVNKTFQNFRQFYAAFGVSRGDGMYIEPENRLKVW